MTEKEKLYHQEYYRKNKAKINAYFKNYRRQNKEKFSVYDRKLYCKHMAEIKGRPYKVQERKGCFIYNDTETLYFSRLTDAKVFLQCCWGTLDKVLDLNDYVFNGWQGERAI